MLSLGAQGLMEAIQVLLKQPKQSREAPGSAPVWSCTCLCGQDAGVRDVHELRTHPSQDVWGLGPHSWVHGRQPLGTLSPARAAMGAFPPGPTLQSRIS